MLSIICYVLAGIMFFCAGTNQTFFSQPQPDEIAWGLFFVVLAWALAGVGPGAPWRNQA